jgi:hypothetical protein
MTTNPVVHLAVQNGNCIHRGSKMLAGCLAQFATLEIEPHTAKRFIRSAASYTLFTKGLAAGTKFDAGFFRQEKLLLAAAGRTQYCENGISPME